MAGFENQWRKRPTMLLECPSGNKCYARRVGPDLALKAGKLANLFGGQVKPDDIVEQMSDEEAAKVYAFARQVIIETVVQPKLSDRALRDDDVTPDDLPSKDFWYLFGWATRAAPGIPVKLSEGETTVEAVETFPDGQTASATPGIDSEQVS